MSVFTSLIIILLAMVIQAFLQLSPAVFAIFYHHALGKTSAKKADDRSLSFVLGTEICIATFFLIIYIIVSLLYTDQIFMNTTFRWIMAGIFLAESIITFFFYFRPSKNRHSSRKDQNSTRLFLSKKLAGNLIARTESAKSRSDTIVLGMVTAALESLFIIPLLFICATEIINISLTSGCIIIIAYIIIATVPLFVVRTFFRTGHNLAEFQRFRVKNKFTFRLIISISFLILAILTFFTGTN